MLAVMQQSSADTPLTDLCAICHVNPIKYTCPRDGIHTCSLPCVKRHKQWAQCSGVRDPAEYRKKSELATPASIDKDFNFITKVERSISRADDNVTDRGIDLVPARVRPRDTRPKVEVEAEAQGIKLIKAPKGLSRSKQNKTCWGGGSPKCMVWTVEWICQDGRGIMSAAPEVRSIGDLFTIASGPKRHTKKRKRPSDAGESRSMTVPKDQSMSGHKEDVRDPVAIDSAVAQDFEQSTTQPPAQDTADTHQADEEQGANSIQEHTKSANPDSYFYLHRPNTESKYRCLIPIASSSTLQEALKNRTLLEFPTIYVRNEAPDQLALPFISEDEYLRRHGDDIPINISAPTQMAAVDQEALEEGELASDPTPLGLNETKVLEVLARDLGS